MSDIVGQLAVKQRKRFIASVLGAAENSPWWAKLSVPEQRTYREKILTSVGVYHDFMLDVIGVSNENSVVNGHALELIERVHEGQRRVERFLADRG